MATPFLTRRDVRSLLSMTAVIDAIEHTFKDWAQGKANMPAKSYLVVDEGDFRAKPAAFHSSAGTEAVHATLSETIADEKQGRKDDEEITIFNSTGIVIEDIAVARLVYEEAGQRGGYLSLDFVEE